MSVLGGYRLKLLFHHHESVNLGLELLVFCFENNQMWVVALTPETNLLVPHLFNFNFYAFMLVFDPKQLVDFSMRSFCEFCERNLPRCRRISYL